MNTFWTIVVFLYLLSFVKGLWLGVWRAAFKTKVYSSFKQLDTEHKVLLVILALMIEFLFNYWAAYFLVWWLGL